MKIYIASSWKLEKMLKVLAERLRQEGFEVDCFCDPKCGRYVFSFTEWGNSEEEIMKTYDAIKCLQDSKTQKAYKEDKKWLDWADTCLLVMPSNRSAHLEAGYIKGKGGKLYIYGEFPVGEWEVMYGMADGLFRTEEFDKLVEVLKQVK